MSAERFQRAAALFLALRGRAEPERLAMLDDSCGDDDELRRQVMQLLEGDSQPDTALDDGALGAAVRVLVDKRRLRGRVSGLGEVEITP